MLHTDQTVSSSVTNARVVTVSRVIWTSFLTVCTILLALSISRRDIFSVQRLHGFHQVVAFTRRESLA